jgi:hypothetical protein
MQEFAFKQTADNPARMAAAIAGLMRCPAMQPLGLLGLLATPQKSSPPADLSTAPSTTPSKTSTPAKKWPCPNSLPL